MPCYVVASGNPRSRSSPFSLPFCSVIRSVFAPPFNATYSFNVLRSLLASQGYAVASGNARSRSSPYPLSFVRAPPPFPFGGSGFLFQAALRSSGQAFHGNPSRESSYIQICLTSLRIYFFEFNDMFTVPRYYSYHNPLPQSVTR